MGLVGDFGKRKLPNGLHSPVLAMQLTTQDRDIVAKILGPVEDPGDDRRQMIRQIAPDWVFIGCYTILFVLIGIVLHKRGNRILGWFVGLLIVPAAIFDVLENLAILELIDSSGVPVISHALLGIASIDPAPRVWSLIKWTLIFFLLVPAARIYFDRGLPRLRRWIGLIAGTLALVASLSGLGGVFSNTDALIEMGSKLMALSLLIGFVFFATHLWLADGLLPALDGLANKTRLRGLTRWPSDEEDPPPPTIDEHCNNECN
jgi:quinol-cytochrome oxidoreductase complex cytochrome b subunit